jgi:MFS family permease
MRPYLTGKFLLLGSLYITQYLPIGFFWVALPAILRQRGASLEQISTIALLGFVWVLKFLWAPLVDRYGSRKLGHYRSWLLAMQSLMVISLLALMPFDVLQDYGIIFAGCVLFTALSATQDIATDALAVQLLLPTERGIGNGMQTAGGLIGNVLGGGVVLIAYGWLGWAGSMAVMAAVVALPLLLVLLFKEQYAVQRAITGEHVTWGTLVRFFRRPGMGRWLVILLCYWIGISLGYGLITPMLVDIGWSLDQIGLATNVVGSLLAVGAALLAGMLIMRITRKAALSGFQLLQAVLLLPLFIPALGLTNYLPNFIAVSIAMMSYSMAATAICTVMMDKSRHSSAGADYTLQYSLAHFTSFAAVGIGVALAGQVGYVVIVAAAVGFSLLSAVSVLGLFVSDAAIEQARTDATLAASVEAMS